MFNEDSRVKIPAILHLCRLGYTYIPKSKQDRLEENNIFPDIFKRSISKINPNISEDEVQRLLVDVTLKLNYDDLGREFFRNWGKEAIEGNYTERVYCIRGADINGINGKGEVKAPERFILKNNSSKKLIPNDFVVEISGGSPVQSTGRIALITESTLERFDTDIICSNFCKAVSIKNEKYIYNFKQEWQRLYDAGVFFGFEGKTSGIKNFLFDSFMNSYFIVLPKKEIVEKYYEFAQSIDKKIQSNLKQNQELSALRDWLLPMLMNGQVHFDKLSEQD